MKREEDSFKDSSCGIQKDGDFRWHLSMGFFLLLGQFAHHYMPATSYPCTHFRTLNSKAIHSWDRLVINASYSVWIVYVYVHKMPKSVSSIPSNSSNALFGHFCVSSLREKI
jgi:hypothetical protein